jgi:hypothetical protein
MLETVSHLGDLYNDQGKLTEAETLCQRALVGFEKALGRDHKSTLEAINNLNSVQRPREPCKCRDGNDCHSSCIKDENFLFMLRC